MKFNKSLDWLKESDEDEIFGDELDLVDEEMNEGLYVDPSNYDKHDDLVDVVDKAGNAQKMTQATYDKNKDSGEFKKKQEQPKDASSKETTKQTEVLPVDPKKYPVLANKVDKVDPELQKVSDNLYEDFYNKNTSKEAARGLKENLLNKFKDYDDNEIASSLLNLPTVGKQSLAIDALDSLAYLDVKNPNNFSKDDKRLYDISRLASEMYYQQSQYNKDVSDKAKKEEPKKQEEPKAQSSSDTDNGEERLNYNDGDEYYHQRFGRLTYNADNDDFVDSDGDHYDADSIDFDELELSEKPELDDDEEDDGWRPPRYRR